MRAVMRKTNNYKYFAIVQLVWIILLLVPWFISRYIIALATTPVNSSPVMDAVYVCAIDFPFIILLSLLGTAGTGMKNRGLMVIFAAFTGFFFFLNTANILVTKEFHRPLSVRDFSYILDPVFVKGSVLPSFFTMESFFFLFAPLIVIFAFLRVLARIRFHASPRQMILVLLIWLAPLYALRKFGYANPTPRMYASTKSLYFHSLLRASPSLVPLNNDEIEELIRLRETLFNTDTVPHQQEPEVINKPNVIVVLLESFRNAEIDCVFQSIPVAPNLKRAKTLGRTYTNFYSNSYMSSRALWTMFTGELGRNEDLIFYKSPSFRAEFFTESLSDYGYKSYWFHGNTSTFENRIGVLPKHGFDFLFDEEALPTDWTPLGWGMPDSVFFQYSIQLLDSLAQLKQPFFSIHFTLSNHHPYKMSQAHSVFDKIKSASIAPYLNGLRYTDYSFGIFLDSLTKRNWFEDSYLLITADNGNKPQDPVINIPEEIENFFHIPMILIGPGVEKGQRDSSFASHIDIAETIFDLTGCRKHMGLGNSLLTDERRGWIPITGTFFGSIVKTRESIYQITPEGAKNQWGQIDAEMDQMINALHRYHHLWDRLIFNGQEERIFCIHQTNK